MDNKEIHGNKTLNPTSPIYITGHRGMAGSAIKRNLESKGYHNLITRNHSDLDLTNQQAVTTSSKQKDRNTSS